MIDECPRRRTESGASNDDVSLCTRVEDVLLDLLNDRLQGKCLGCPEPALERRPESAAAKGAPIGDDKLIGGISFARKRDLKTRRC